MRQHLVVLDGLRGVAALCVLLLHTASTFGLPPPLHAGLAVDFFFALSGFVIAHAYDDRLRSGMSLGAFMRLRAVRLYPMILASVLLGALSVWPKISLLHLSGAAILLPTGLLSDAIAFPLNFALWSLFFEVVASALYGVFGARIGWRMLALVCAASGLLLGAATLAAGEISHFGVKGLAHFAMGVPRVLYPFCLGVLLYRLKASDFAPRVPAWTLMAGVAALLLAPLGASGIYDALVAILVLPAVVVLGARAASRADPVYRALGEISYPLYAVHVPVLVLVARGFGQGSWIGGFVGALCAVIAAWCLLKIYDEPVRKRLSRRAPRPAPSPASA
jgi:peptidoglycan/LPS O-acetylase OafA/YrhL